jgi:hypothetical protein
MSSAVASQQQVYYYDSSLTYFRTDVCVDGVGEEEEEAEVGDVRDVILTSASMIPPPTPPLLAFVIVGVDGSRRRSKSPAMTPIYTHRSYQ